MEEGESTRIGLNEFTRNEIGENKTKKTWGRESQLRKLGSQLQKIGSQNEAIGSQLRKIGSQNEAIDLGLNIKR